MEMLAEIALGVAAAAFVAGLLISAITGSVRAVKLFLGIVAGVAAIALVGGLVFSRGLLVYLLFQLIAGVLILLFVVIAGAVCGGGIYLLRHRKPAGMTLQEMELADYLPLAEFCTLEGISEDKALARSKNGYYRAGLHAGAWHIHKAELSQAGK